MTKKESLQNFLKRTNRYAVSLNNKLELLTEQLREYPETKKYFPRDETLTFQRSLTTLIITLKQFTEHAKGHKNLWTGYYKEKNKKG